MSGETSPELEARAKEGDVVALARTLVAIPSVNPALEEGGAGEAAVARRCAGWLRDWGFQVTLDEPRRGRVSVVGRLGGGSPSRILSGHLDTVGVDGMRVPPFQAEVRDGRLWGRGSADMKGGVAALLAAACAVATRPGALRGELLVVLSADEEHASEGLRALLDGGLQADAAVVTEPTGLSIAPANKGFVWIEAEFRGVPAHGSRPEVGRDAIRAAGRFLAALDSYEARARARPAHPFLGYGSIHAGTISGGSSPSVYPARCHLVLEARTLPGEGPEDVRRRVRRVAAEAGRGDPDVEVVLTPGLHRPGAELPAEHPLVRSVARALETEGLPVRIEPMTAWVESAWFLEAGIPALCFGPGSIHDAHTADESVAIDELERAASVLRSWVEDVPAEGVGDGGRRGGEGGGRGGEGGRGAGEGGPGGPEAGP